MHMVEYCPHCGKETIHRHETKRNSVEHDYQTCLTCGTKSHTDKHVPDFVGIRSHGLGGFF